MPEPLAPPACPRSGGGLAAAGDHADAGGPPRSWLLLVLLCAAQFMVILDVTVVNVALPSIGADLGFAAGDLQWVVTAYVLCTGGLMLLGGRAADLLGRRPLLLAGLALFTAASLACGLAPSAGALVAARAVQGVGAALLVPAALATITTAYAGRQRAVALGVWGAIGSAGAAAGVLAGGVLTSLLSWEWVFLVNVPIGAVALAGVIALVPVDRPAAGHAAVRGGVAGANDGAAGGDGGAPRAHGGAAGAHGGAADAHGGAVATRPARGLHSLDLGGAVALVGGLALLVCGLERAGEHGWGAASTLLPLAAGAALLAAFAAIERRVRQPLIPPQTWRVRSLVASAAVMLGATGLLVGSFFLNTLYLQGVVGASALETGLAFLPLALAIVLGAHLASRLMPRVGTRTLVLGGLALVAAACALLAAAPDRATYATDLLPAFLLLGLGVGPLFVSASVAAMADVDHARAGLASGLMTTAHELGAAIGVAVLSAVALTGGLGGDPAALAAGYQDGFVVAALAAAGLAAVALPALPSVRPAAGVRAAAH